MTRPFRIITMVISMCAGLASASIAAEPRTYDGIVVFGDSLSDTGNAAGARFSNGPVWVEHLASHFSLPVEPAISGGTNYAVGGARAHDPGSPYNLRAQADRYLAEEPDRKTVRRTLFIVYGGANDLLAAVSGRDPVVLATDAVRVLAGIADDLASAGAGTILMPNLPDLAKVPAVRQFGPTVGRIASQVTTGFNQALDRTIAGVEARRGTRVVRLDVHGLVERVFRDPGVLGRPDVNLTDPCAGAGRICAEPDRYIFWDQVHPTAFGHARLANAALRALAGNGDR
ncbi:SGNH/GDSL hydrolase family protein [Skermanella mucosa]|uniref:SGNH/GDSL hydrolase family protein n=1 Tax=Skermanella mucosa TaxID=1789672 RepID=UPI00192C1312|nr:SGNH/GDSL hydrolase family protein [Skermanella mucosa]UEM23154.1 SGNH/GDSL hydrolase family protein [Skermanella mucosa]